MDNARRVVITGVGVAAPIGIGVDAFWDALLRRRCGLGPIDAFDSSGMKVRIGGELPPFNFSDCIPKTYRKSAKVMARDIVIAVLCAYHAARDAGLRTRCLIDRGEVEGPPNLDSRRFGANIGAGLICADLNELAGALSSAADPDGRFSLKRWGAEGMNNLTPLWLLKFLPNMLACHVTIVHDAQAPSNTITCGEASSHLAIGEGCRTIARGDAEVCICGGAESKINPMAMVRPYLWGVLNTEGNDDPQTACRPFNAARAGAVAAEGGGLVILESLEHARARKARIYAEVIGFAAAADTTGWTKPDPQGRGVALALRRALAEAGLGPEEIDLVVPFGLGTSAHDASEMAGFNAVFGERLERIPAMVVRGAVGNNGAGSGAIDFGAMVAAVHRGVVPPSINVEPADSASRFRFVRHDPVDARIRHALCFSRAVAGGQCAALVIRRFQEHE